jgi:hypothetical protein
VQSNNAARNANMRIMPRIIPCPRPISQRVFSGEYLLE